MPGVDVRQKGRTLAPEVARSLKRFDGSVVKVVIEIEYAQVGGITPACANCIAAVFGRFGPMPIGTRVVKKISGTDTWSQHSYGNAVDFMCSGALHRSVAYFINANRGALSIHWLGADPYFPSPLGDHYNHVHADFYPQWGGTPPGHPI
jgi:hypothetical protein